MKFDIYQSIKKAGTLCTPDLFKQATESEETARLVELYRNGTEAKASKALLPAICWHGFIAGGGVHKASETEPSGLVMLDIDHMTQDPHTVGLKLCADMEVEHLYVVHITPSGKGLRLVFPAKMGLSIGETQKFVSEKYNLAQYGDVDFVTKDLSRLSFLVGKQDFLLFDERVFTDAAEFLPELHEQTSLDIKGTARKYGTRPTADEIEALRTQMYNNVMLPIIVDRYLVANGQPIEGQRNQYFFEMAKGFRQIVENNPSVLYAILPDFGLDDDERWQTCRSACSKPVASKLPVKLYYTLKDNGWLPSQPSAQDDSESQGERETREYREFMERMPALPPVFREYVASAPYWFKLPTIFALLPLLGMLTTRRRGRYIDGTTISTTFDTICYAPASSGKSFANRLYDEILSDVLKRDYVQELREEAYLKIVQRTKNVDQLPPDPEVAVRCWSPIMSNPKILKRMRNLHDLHAIIFAPEIDTFAKGSRGSAWSEKSDMLRVGWENGMYGQDYMSQSTFTGKVRLYFNCLLMGTPSRVFSFFKNVEDGLVTRCSFVPIEGQEFAEFQPWKQMNDNQQKVVRNLLQKLDRETYLNAPEDEEQVVNEEIPFKMEWAQKATLEWLERQRQRALLEASPAIDCFRKRVAQKMNRLILLCSAMYSRVTEKERKRILDFALWWADVDLHYLCRAFADEFNRVSAEQESAQGKLSQSALFALLDDVFTVGDLTACLLRTGTKSPARAIIYNWKKAGYIEKSDKGTFFKIKK